MSPKKSKRFFHDAEESAVDILDQILTEGGKQLHRHYLEKKATPFAATTVSSCILANLAMCFVAHEEIDDAKIETEADAILEPNQVDYWGRIMRPLMPLDEHEKMKASRDVVKETGGGSPSGGKKSPDNKKSGGAADAKEQSDKDRKVKINEEVVIDEEENKFREMKAREETKKTEAGVAKQKLQKASDNEQKKKEALASEMEGKQFAFDTEGRLLWVDAVDANKLPKFMSEVTSSTARQKPQKEPQRDEPPASPADSKGAGKGGKRGGSPKSSQGKRGMAQTFSDGFTRLTTEQPPILETMKVVAGVTLGHKGQLKKGPVQDDHGRMSRSRYQDFLDAEESGNATFDFGATARSPEKPDTASDIGGGGGLDQSNKGKPGSATSLGGGGGAGGDLPPLSVNPGDLPKSGAGAAAASGPGSGRDFGESPMGSARQVGLSAPSTTKDWRLKRDAVGHLGRFPRHHVGLLGTTAAAGFARCLPQPVYGATMGHGLGPHAESFFFPEEFEKTMSRASTTGKSFYTTARSWKSETSIASFMEADRKGVVKMIRELDVKRNIQTSGGTMKTREKARALLGRNVIQK